MKLNLDRISDAPQEVDFEAPASWWRDRARGEGEPDCEILEPFCIALRVHRIGEKIDLEGQVEGLIELECSRCVARYRHALRDPFRLILEKAGERVPPDPEGVESLARDGLCLTDELETGWYRGSEIKLDDFFGEVISVAMPIHPLCNEDCAGLCPSCGARRADAKCGCTVTEIEDEEAERQKPFAVLAKLRDAMSEKD